MGSNELLNEFTLLYNNINSNAAPGLESFEISQLLTKAQGEKISNAFNPEGNKYKEGFDDSIKRQHDFSTIIKVQTLKSASPTTKIDSRSLVFTPPEDLLFPINEILYIGDKVIQVFPISYNEYTLKLMKPYNEPYKRSAWRLVGLDGNIEVIPAYNDRKLITSDNVLSPVEKSAQRKEWNIIASEKSNIDSQADSFLVSRTNYDNAFQTLATYLNNGTIWSSGIPLWLNDDNLSTNTTIIGLEYRNNWLNLYTQRILLLNLISVKAKSLADTAQTTADNAEKSAETAQTKANPASDAALSAQNTADAATTAANIAIGTLDNITSGNISYKMRYVKKPKPILLEDYTADGYSIEGETGGKGYDFKNPCELPDSMQHEIVQRAVELAKAAYQPEEAQIQTQMGTRSE